MEDYPLLIIRSCQKLFLGTMTSGDDVGATLLKNFLLYKQRYAGEPASLHKARLNSKILFVKIGRCAKACNQIAKLPKSEEGTWAFQIVRLVLTGFGGGIIVPIMIGEPILPVRSDPCILLSVMFWFLFFVFPGKRMAHFYNLPIVNEVWILLEETFRANSVCTSTEKVWERLGGLSLTGPIICGTIGGCGGLFAINGKEVLHDELRWNILSAMLGASFVTFQVLGDPCNANLLFPDVCLDMETARLSLIA
eukprot:jgi/Bigna1/86450/estExt_fgenesh1_pg.C_100276